MYRLLKDMCVIKNRLAVLLICLVVVGLGHSSLGAVVITRVRPAAADQGVAKEKVGDQVRYDHGQPSNAEQYLLELVNRARANPTKELERLLTSGDRYIESALASFDVDLDRLRDEFAGYPSQPPLAFNDKLISSARSHSRDMADNDFQGHTSADGSDLAERLDAVGYRYIRAGENVFAYAHSMEHTQAAFLIDWGVEGLGHRRNLLNLDEGTDFREIGIGVVSENSPATAVGPWVVTQDFGTTGESKVFIVGVAYRDANGNGFYDPGEGLSGVEVRPDQGGYYAVTSRSGGYAIPVSGDSGEYHITASRSDLSGWSKTVYVGRSNVKVDFVIGDPKYGNITGTVVDETGAPVAGVEMVLAPVGLHTVTGTDGSFQFFDLPAASYRLDAELPGYEFQPNNFIVTLDRGEDFETRLTAKRVEDQIPSSEGGGSDDNGNGSSGSDDSGVCGGPLVIVAWWMVFSAGLLQTRVREFSGRNPGD